MNKVSLVFGNKVSLVFDGGRNHDMALNYAKALEGQSRVAA